MALPLPPGLTPPEIAFLCDMELVTVIPRQRLESLQLLSGPTPPLNAGRSSPLPLYLALLLHRQRRADILPPPWLSATSLEAILKAEIDNPTTFSASMPWPKPPRSSASIGPRGSEIVSPPFLAQSTAVDGESKESHLPYHWLELGELLLGQCPDSFGDAGVNYVRGLLRDIREVRQSKLRAGMKGLEGGGVVSLRGVGAMEVATERAFVVGVIEGLRKVGASREAARREREEERGQGGDEDNEDEMDEMDI